LKPLSRSFYLRPTLQVAQELLGKYFIRRSSKNLLIGKIVEVEAYRSNDPASHSFRGKTNRNSVMFCDGGHLYVYFTYGMHFCANIVTGKEGIGEAVLIRAVEPLVGIEVMKRNRYGSNKSINLQSLNHKILLNLSNGPAKFCQAFGIARQENGLDLLDGEISITDGKPIPSKLIKRSSRIGIQQGIKKNWRFFIAGNPWVSRK
jgi:DNA-3-methyladenine glycosylase